MVILTLSFAITCGVNKLLKCWIITILHAKPALANYLQYCSLSINCLSPATVNLNAKFSKDWFNLDQLNESDGRTEGIP